MRLHRLALAAACAAALFMPVLAHAAGYGIYEQGASALGMAGAVTASIHDPAAEFYNPAVLPALEGRSLYVGGTWLSTRVSFAGVDPSPGYGITESMKNGNFFPPAVYWTNHLNKTWAYGVGVNAPFGLGVEWQNPSTFTGRTRVTKAMLSSINANLSLAWQMSQGFSVAAGFDALYAAVELNNTITKVIPGGGGATANVASARLKSGMTPGYGFNTAFSWKPNDAWKFGAYYRSKIDVKVDNGKATFTQIGTGDASFDALVAAGLPKNQGATTTLRFPAMWSAGAAWNPEPNWTWEADFGWTQWSTFDKLALKFAATPSLNTDIVEEYKDCFRVSVGAEHRLPKYTYRFGYYFDEAAAPTQSVTPLLPDANRHGATFGMGWNLGAKKRWTLDAYELALFVEDRSTEGTNRDHFDGTYKSFINAAGAGLAYHW